MLSTHILSFLGGVCFGLLCILWTETAEQAARQLVARAAYGSLAMLASKHSKATTPVPKSTATSRNTSESILQWGHPGPISDDLLRDEYMANFNRRDRLPNWVAEHLDIFSLTAGEGVDRSRSAFAADPDIPTMFRAQLKDYIASGFDRGHQAPAADAVYTQEAMDQTFYLTNMAPQVGIGFNRHCKCSFNWAYVEEFVRDLVGPYTDVWVWTGPLFLPQKGVDNKFYMKYQVLGNPPSIAVPTHFYKVVLAQMNMTDTTYSTAAFLLPNQAIPIATHLTQFKVAKELIERASGLTFLTEKVTKMVRDLCTEVVCDIKPGRP
ncbi:hypothetical protein INT43_008845 [Umbelopsis isabellina]|uniref:Endonuclease n=1 Tax=Mortierella isabellina TaxID=91625 RepID=A0A8H7PVV9_MORIS|nr:hypothetical protein INT43_008845 [Umbelopsis isabellina]